MRSAPFTPADFTDRPFGCPPDEGEKPGPSTLAVKPLASFSANGRGQPSPIVTVVELPFPPSTNRIWARGGHGGVTLSKDYRAWKDQADKFVLFTGAWRRASKITGRFTFELVLDANERKRGGDLDNRIKATLDWCQSRELIRNDSDCDDVHAYWGEAPHGCRVTLTEIVSRRVMHPAVSEAAGS